MNQYLALVKNTEKNQDLKLLIKKLEKKNIKRFLKKKGRFYSEDSRCQILTNLIL